MGHTFYSTQAESGRAQDAQALLGMLRLFSGSDQVRSPSPPVKSSSCSRPQTKAEPGEGKINPEYMGIHEHNVLARLFAPGDRGTESWNALTPFPQHRLSPLRARDIAYYSSSVG
jgi:hypothetical protein